MKNIATLKMQLQLLVVSCVGDIGDILWMQLVFFLKHHQSSHRWKKKDLHVCMLRILHSSLTSCKYFLFSVSSHFNLLEHCKWHFLSYVNKIVKYHTWCSANCSEQFLKSTFDTWSSDEPVVGGEESGTSFKYTAGATTAVFHDSGNLPGSREELITGVKWTSWRD